MSDPNEYLNRAGNFLSGMRRSHESGIEFNWQLLRQQLNDLFYQTHRDGVSQGSKLLESQRFEREMMEKTLDKLLEMGAKQAKTSEAKRARMALKSLEYKLVECFQDVIVDSLDLSGRKLEGLIGKFVERISKLSEELELDEQLEEEHARRTEL